MVQLTVWATALFVGLNTAQSYPADVVDKLAESSLAKLKAWLEKNPQGNCTYEKAVKRREWLVTSPRSHNEHPLTRHRSNLTVQERKAYTDAVLCLQSKPALTTAQAPGAKSRFDDYGMT